MLNEGNLSPQKSFLLDIGARNLPDDDNVIWLVENILADLAQDDCELLKAKYGLAGGYTTYTDRELAAIFQLDIGEFKSSLGRAKTAASAVLRRLEE